MITLACLSCSPLKPNCRNFLRMDDIDENECYYYNQATKIIREYEKTGRITNREFLSQYLAQRGEDIEGILKLLPEE